MSPNAESHTDTVAATPISALHYKSAQDIERTVFPSDNMEKASKRIGDVLAICLHENVPVDFTWDTDQELPDNYSIAIVPLTETIKGKGRVIMSVLIGVFPDIQTILQDAAGAAWAVKKLSENLISQLKNTRNKMINAAELDEFPFTVADFVSTGKTSVYAGYNLVAVDFVKALKKKSKSLSFISKILLRQILASAQFAEQQFPRIDQKNWVFIINSMIKTCLQCLFRICCQ